MEDQRIDVSLLSTRQAIITLIGDFDLADAARLKDVSQLAFSLSPHVVLDAGQVTFLDSTVIAWLVHNDRAAVAASGSFTVANPSQRVRHLLELTGLDEVMKIMPSVTDATTLSNA